MKVYLIRHAESQSREGMNYKESGSISLSEYGRKEARVLGRKMSRYNIERIFTSPLKRARETAEIIAPKGVDIVEDERLVEWAPSHTLVGSEYKKARDEGRDNPDAVISDGESFNGAADRFLSFLNELDEVSYKNVAVVSHALAMEALIKHLFRLEKPVHVDTASVTLITKEGGNFHLKYIGKKPITAARIIRALRARSGFLLA